MRRTGLAVLAAMICFGGSAAAETTILTNATLIDGTGSPPQPNMSITITDGRIVAIKPTPQPRPGTTIDTLVPSDTTIIDLSGKFVVPGIINAHGHVGPAPRDPQLRQYALYGVTTTTSMYFDQD